MGGGATNDNPKVFLSSTTIGLAEMRATTREAIKAADCTPIMMEDFGSVPDYPDVVCQKQLDKCDLYVAVLGWRYGSCPAGSNLSYTEREFRYAGMRGLPRLVFLLTEQLCDEEVAIEPRETPAVRGKQERFRDFARAETTAPRVASTAELARQVKRSLVACLNTEPWGVSEVVGRRTFLKDLRAELLEDRLDVALVGHPGSGKSAICRAMEQWLRGQARLDTSDARVWSQGLPEGTTMGAGLLGPTPLGGLADLCVSALGPGPASEVATIDELVEALARQLADGRPTLIALDNLWPSHLDAVQVLYCALAQHTNVSVLVTTRFPDLPNQLSTNAPRTVHTRAVHPLDEDAAVQMLVWNVARHIGATRRQIRPDLVALDEVLRPLARFCGGYPKALELLAGLVATGGGSLEHLRRRAETIEVELREEGWAGAVTTHARSELDALYRLLLGRWLQDEGLGDAARDVLAVCTLLPPLPVSYYFDTLKRHWLAALDGSLFPIAEAGDRRQQLYDPERLRTTRRKDPFFDQVASLSQKHLLTEAGWKSPGRTSRCQSGSSPDLEPRFGHHAVVGDYFSRHLWTREARTRFHEAAEAAVHSELEEGPLASFSGMFAIEGTRWQEKIALWLFHLAHLERVHPAQGRFRLARLYLDAFWWWGYNVEFPFCAQLISSWERVQVRDEAIEDQVEFVHELYSFHNNYPRGWDKAGSNMRPVRQALTGMAGHIGIDLTRHVDGYEDEEHLHVHGLLHTFLAHCALFESASRPLPDDDFDEAKRHYEIALSAFLRVARDFTSHADEWNESWVLCELAELHIAHGDAGIATDLSDQAERREYGRVEESRGRNEARARAGQEPDEDECVFEETLSNISSVRGDIAQDRGERDREAEQRGLAVLHAFANQVRPPQALPCEGHDGRFEGGPDPYTTSFYQAMSTRAARRVLELSDEGEDLEAGAMARTLARPFASVHSPRCEAVIQALESGKKDRVSVKTIADALFPATFDEHRYADAEALDDYVRRGLEILIAPGRRSSSARANPT